MNEKISNLNQTCSVRKLKFYDGREGDERIIVVDNGCLSFTLLQDNGLDIHDFRYKGVNMAYITKGGLLGYDADFGRRFNGGMVYTCGLDTVGGRALPVHGKYHNLPAQIDSIISNEKFVEINATIKDCAILAQNLVLKRKIYCEYGSGKITIDNKIINQGYVDADYCVLFHMNIGYPMLDEGVKILADIVETEPRTEFAKSQIENCLEIQAPKAGMEEQVFFHKVKEGYVKVVNEKIKKVMTFKYDAERLPYFIEWKSMASGDYALGIEPSTTTLDGGFNKVKIKAQEEHDYKIEIEVADL